MTISNFEAKDYSVNDLVLYNKKYYRCKSALTLEYQTVSYNSISGTFDDPGHCVDGNAFTLT